MTTLGLRDAASSDLGCGVHAGNSTLYMNNTVCSDNTGAQGGCLAAATSYNLAFADVVMNNNYAENGGAIYISGCNDLVAYNVTMKNNTATVSGCGIFQVSGYLPALAHPAYAPSKHLYDCLYVLDTLQWCSQFDMAAHNSCGSWQQECSSALCEHCLICKPDVSFIALKDQSG